MTVHRPGRCRHPAVLRRESLAATPAMWSAMGNRRDNPYFSLSVFGFYERPRRRPDGRPHLPFEMQGTVMPAISPTPIDPLPTPVPTSTDQASFDAPTLAECAAATLGPVGRVPAENAYDNALEAEGAALSAEAALEALRRAVGRDHVERGHQLRNGRRCHQPGHLPDLPAHHARRC